ncbi:MAG TPA: membrane dipeptidase [Saprospiraceae bacterium]|nr:membrane dipeptidase [Saprospiraceae bacterium]
MFIFDAHLDLSMNAMDWNRDLTQSIDSLNGRESGQIDLPGRGNATVTFEELRKGNIGMVVATQIARYTAKDNALPGWQSPQQAWAHTQGQLAWYREMEACGELVQIKNLTALHAHINDWQAEGTIDKKAIGYILSLEGADSIVDVSYVERAFNYGLRAIGPAHYGPGRYAFGTNASGGLGLKGRELLKEMEHLQIILDATHLCDISFWEALENFHGFVWASHNLCRSLVNHNRQFDDDQIKALIERGAVIGGALDAWMMVPNWIRGLSNASDLNCSLETLIDHFDHICQLAGNADHIALGTDLDGGFGTEQCPHDLTSIADLNTLPDLLQKRGYSSEDVKKILHGNWIEFLNRAWANLE